MAMSSKFDLSSGSPDRPLYTSGQRGALLAAQLDRSGSFRETMENQILSSLPSMSRSGSVAAQGDVSSFFQCLRFDPKVVAADHKSNRQGDFKRHINVALGISADESTTMLSKGKLLPSPIPEEIKRVKTGLRDCSVKARERVKTFNEALSVFNKFFPSIPSKKRSRSESFSNDRPNALLSGDRSVLGPTIGKMGMHNNSVAGGFEFEQQKSEERPKSTIPNKRTRTSLVDVRMDMRNNALVRQPGNADRDKEMLRVPNSGSVQGEDRTLSGSIDGWEKTKMKKKRSGIKPDVSPSMVSTKLEGYRESKQGIQQKAVSDARSRLSNDSHGFRSGIANGSVGVGKPEGISQQSGLGPRSSVPRTDPDTSSLLNDRRDRTVASDKERVNLRATNKMSVRDEFNSASPTSSTKMNASIRGPRSGTGVAPKLSPVVHRATASIDWELSHCTNKPPTAGGATNRKRTASARSSSPPVAHWASQRPQKSSRTARRTNIVPFVSNNDETPSLDTVSDMAGNEIGSGFARRFSSSSPQQIKLKGDALSSATLSESEESGAAEIKSKEKVKKSDEIDEKSGQNVQKVSTLVLSSRKNKLMTGEDIGDGVRRQGRTGRGITSTRSLMPMTVEKFGNVRTAKQLRSARLGLEKTESKAGRPPTRKLTDRKAYSRQKHAAMNAAADILVGSEDVHEEIVAAVNALVGSGRAFPNSFWRQMEPFLGFISDADIAYLKQQGNHETRPGSTPLPSIADGCSTIFNGCGLLEKERAGRIAAVTSNDELLSKQLLLDKRDNNLIPLCQRFLAALIPEEDSDSGNEDLQFDIYGAGFQMDGELGSNGLRHIVNFQSTTEHASFNGYRTSGKPECDDPEIDMVGKTGISSTFSHSLNGTFLDKPMPDMVCSEFEYEGMKINEKILLEAQSIGIFLEPMPDITQMDDDEICEDVGKLEEKLDEQVSRKKGLLDKLLNAASETRALQEKEFEQNALDKLVTMAYEKYMSCWGPNATGGKSSSNKMIKQAALAFVKRTLDQYHKFEDSGKSCFDEPMLRDIFVSGSSRLNDARPVDTPTDGGESGKPCAYSSTRSLEGRTSGQSGDSYAVDLLPPTNRLSDQTTVKDDSWSNKVKKRELSLEDVVAGTIGASSVQPGIGSSLSSSAKGKRSERDRDGKGLGREVLSRNGTNKIGRPASNVKGERKLKIKPKQKMTQLSVSVNGILGEMSEHPKPSTSISKSNEITINNNAKEKDDFGLDVLDDLQLPGQDLGSWLNIDDDGLQDHDFMGLEIPMDDLSDLNMMV